MNEYLTPPDSILVAEVLQIVIGLAIGGGLICLVYAGLSQPLRRAERTRRFLDLLESALKNGRPLEETLVVISHLGDPSLGVRFHLFAAWLERGLSFDEALAKVPRFLGPQIAAMLNAGHKIGDIRKVVPACRQLLQDAASRTRSAVNYFFLLAFIITPFGLLLLVAMNVMVAPKFKEVANGMGVDIAGIDFLTRHGSQLMGIQICLLFLVWLYAIIYGSDGRFSFLFPFLDRVNMLLPWRRKRLQRDFSTMLALLLDSGVPEPEAVTLAADSAANDVFRRRAVRVVEKLRQGVTLPQAVLSMDDSGEFAWRLANAYHGRVGFLQALAGWHEALDAKAFQLEQAASQGITTALVLWSGLYVGAIAISVFSFLVSIINSSALW